MDQFGTDQDSQSGISYIANFMDTGYRLKNDLATALLTVDVAVS